jgi:hypothetical protein
MPASITPRAALGLVALAFSLGGCAQLARHRQVASPSARIVTTEYVLVTPTGTYIPRRVPLFGTPLPTSDPLRVISPEEFRNLPQLSSTALGRP